LAVAVDENPGADPELDEDENGFGYPSTEYLYEKKQMVMAIRIDMLEKINVIVRTFGAETGFVLMLA
jgi:hypothetical protein